MKNEKTFLFLKDHSVSGEQFELIYNQYEGILETHPQPQVEELSKYYESEDYISHTDTKQNLLEQLYHLVRKISLKRKLKLINYYLRRQDQSFKPTRRLLDVGCGTGDFLKIAQNDDWRVIGIEPNINARNIANQKTNNIVIEKLEDYKDLDNKFDVITLWHVFEHIHDLDNQINLLKPLLEDKGTLIIAVPNYKSYDAEYYKSFWAAYDVPRHLWHFSQNGIKQLLEGFGFVCQKTLPMLFDSFYVSLLSEKYKRGFMNPFMAFWIGLRSNLKAKRSGEYSSLIYVFKKG